MYSLPNHQMLNRLVNKAENSIFTTLSKKNYPFIPKSHPQVLPHNAPFPPAAHWILPKVLHDLTDICLLMAIKLKTLDSNHYFFLTICWGGVREHSDGPWLNSFPHLKNRAF